MLKLPSKKMKRYIVKVQLPLAGYMGDVLIYNEDQSILEQFPIPKGLKKMMNGEKKQFFYAHTDKNKMLVLDEIAPWQDW